MQRILDAKVSKLRELRVAEELRNMNKRGVKK